MSSVTDESRPDAPRHGESRLTFGEFLGGIRDSAIATYPPQDFDKDIIVRRLLSRSTFIVNEPGGIRHVLIDNAQNYQKAEVGQRILVPGLGNGLLTASGETWRRHRRIMAPAFDPRSLVGYAPIMTEVAERLVAKWEALPAGSEVDVAAAMLDTTLHVISRAMFSSDSDAVIDVVAKVATVNNRWVYGPFSPEPTAGFFDEFDKLVERMIAARGDGSAEPKDLLTRLIAARDSETGGGMSAREVRDQVVTIFLAGHETTAQALTWTWYLLSQNPQAEAKLHAELAAVLQGRAPRHEDIPQLRYARMVIDESMRLYPPAHTLGRQSIEADEILGHQVPAKSTVLIVPWMLHRKPSLWDDPDRFEPERFSPENAAGRPRFAYIPFGAGPRICIGAALAIEEALLVIGTIAQRYRLRLKPGHPVEPQGLVTLRPRHGLPMTLEPRRN